MGEVELQDQPAHLEENLEFVADCCRYAENILTEKQVKKKWKFDDATWEKLGSDGKLIEAVELEKTRRVRTGQQKRERAQLLITKAPDILDSIANDVSASPRHRVDAIKVLDDFSATGPENTAPAADRFVIQINLGSDVLKFDKSIEINPNDIDPNDTGTAPPGPWPVIAAKKVTESDGNGQPV